MKSISAKYDPATNIAPETESATHDRYAVRQKTVASREDAQYSLNLVRSTFTDRFELVIYSNRVNADAELATAQAIKLEEQERPLREAERQKKDADDLEVATKESEEFSPIVVREVVGKQFWAWFREWIKGGYGNERKCYAVT